VSYSYQWTSYTTLQRPVRLQVSHHHQSEKSLLLIKPPTSLYEILTYQF